jgi:hypothetical protein
VWLTDGRAPHADVHVLAEQGMLLVEKATVGGLVHYLRAEAIFFTHGLYGSPRPCRRKPIVNLWHGDGPKETRPGNDAGSLIPSTYLVAGTQLFGHHKGTAFEIPPGRLLVTGNPRTDQFWQPPCPEALAGLGITGDFVVWMPTFRRTRPMRGLRSWSEIDDPASDTSNEQVRSLIDGLQERGIQLVIKPHPMDADRRHVAGAVRISETDLVRSGVSLYSLLGASRGLVTDYSSVWVDYLLLDRPMAFLVNDRESYSSRLVPSDVLDWLPGELVGQDGRPFETFLADLDSGCRTGSTLRREVARRVGLNPTRTAADDLLDALVERGVVSSTQRECAHAGARS